MLRGDMGESIKFRRPVSKMIAERIPNTLILVGVSFLVTLIIALPVGILSARKPYSVFDYTATRLTFIGQSVPLYWLHAMGCRELEINRPKNFELKGRRIPPPR
jgi:peptide/nickel transport system permease protein